jgi:hypothetical protein
VCGLEKLRSNTPCLAEYPLWVLVTDCSVLISLDVNLAVKSRLYYEKI